MNYQGMELFSDGILFFIGIQLVIVSLVHFYERANQKNLYLGFICLITGLWYFYFVFYYLWKKNFVYGILIGADKLIFIPVLLLFYFKSIYKTIDTRYIVRHMIAPSLFYILSLVMRFAFPEKWLDFNNKQIPWFLIGTIALFWIYFFIIRKELTINLRQQILPKVYKRTRFLFYSFYSLFLCMPLFDLTKSFIDSIYFSDYFEINNAAVYKTFFEYLKDCIYCYFFLISYFISLYAITELYLIKRLLFPSNALLSKQVVSHKGTLGELIHNEVVQKKAFLDPSMTIALLAKKLGIRKREILDYLKLTQNGSFIDFINELRVNEFKALVKQEKNEQYDLIGLAKECGFKSKSTFFRVFKKLEGMTPNDYKKSIE